MRATVFLGPSLPLGEARELFPAAVFRPPAAQGDLLAAVDHDNAEMIGLIDGTFHQTLSVWHSEVCHVLNRGVAVFGASSMGALRACETELYGAVGVGTIFEWYRDGVVIGDDEVAMLHGPEEAGYPHFSLVLVNIRASMSEAVRRGRLPEDSAARVIDVVRSIYYPRRDLPTIMRTCREQGFSKGDLDAIELALTADHVDQKRLDARELLTMMSAVHEGSVPRPPRVPFEFHRSSVFETLYNLDRRAQVDGAEVTLQSIRERAALHDKRYEEVQHAALDRSIVAVFGGLLGLDISSVELDGLRRDFMVERSIASDEALREWLRDNAMSEADLNEYVEDEARCNRLRRWILQSRGMDRSCRAVLDEARRRGVFREWARFAMEFDAVVAAYEHQPEYRSLREADPRQLAARHNASAPSRIGGDAADQAEMLGFDDVGILIEALEDSVIYYDVMARIDRHLRALKRAEKALVGKRTRQGASRRRVNSTAVQA